MLPGVLSLSVAVGICVGPLTRSPTKPSPLPSSRRTIVFLVVYTSSSTELGDWTASAIGRFGGGLVKYPKAAAFVNGRRCPATLDIAYDLGYPWECEIVYSPRWRFTDRVREALQHDLEVGQRPSCRVSRSAAPEIATV